MSYAAGGPRPCAILSGTVRLYASASWVDATVGHFLYVPRGGVHAFANAADAEASMLILFSPGAMV